MSANGSDIQKYNYTVTKAVNNGINVDVTHDGFTLTNASNKGMLGKFVDVDSMFQYLCGYEAGLDRGLIDGSQS